LYALYQDVEAPSLDTSTSKAIFVLIMRNDLSSANGPVVKKVSQDNMIANDMKLFISI